MPNLKRAEINRRNMQQETARKRWQITEAYGIKGMPGKKKAHNKQKIKYKL